MGVISKSWLFFHLIWKNYVLYWWDFDTKSWIVDFLTHCTRKNTRKQLLSSKFQCRNSYFLHWNFDEKSSFVVFFHEWNKVALDPTKNFTCKGRSLLPQHKKLAGEHIGCLPSSTVSWWRHDSCANLTNSQYSVKTVLLGRRLMWLQPTFLCRGSSNRPLHVTIIAGSKASLI